MNKVFLPIAELLDNWFLIFFLGMSNKKWNILHHDSPTKPATNFFATIQGQSTENSVRKTAMIESFTEQAIKVMMLAIQESRQLGHNFYGTEQLLLGTIGVEDSIAARALKSMGVTLDRARVEVEKIIGRGSWRLVPFEISEIPLSPDARRALALAAEIPFSPNTRRALELAEEECQQLGH